jgi:hypothetical protein
VGKRADGSAPNHVGTRGDDGTAACCLRNLPSKDSRLTVLGVYRQTPKNRCDPLSPGHRAAFDRAIEWARIGTEEWAPMGINAAEEPLTVPREATNTPA